MDILDRMVPAFPEKVSVKVHNRLRKMGVEVLLRTNVCSVAPDCIELKQDGVCTRDLTATVIWTAGVEAARIVQQAEGIKRGRGRLRTDKYLRALGREDVYARRGRRLLCGRRAKCAVPQMVENAEQSARTAARNITADILGTGGAEEYAPKFHGAMLSVGGRYCAAYVGTDTRKISWRRFCHVCQALYKSGLLYSGFRLEQNIPLPENEIFAIRNCRSFVGGHFSNRTPSFLLVPLRVWLGAVWVYEGIMKIIEGWMKTPKLEGFFSGAAAWFNAILYGSADGSSGATAASAAAAADAVSSATANAAASPAAETAGHVLFNVDILGLFKAIFVSGKPPAHSVISDYAFKLDIPLINWFVNYVLLKNPGIAMAMQVVIVLRKSSSALP